MLDLTAVPVVDQHAHNLLRPEELASFDYLSAFTEAAVVDGHARDTLFFRRSLREIAAVLECEPSLESALAARARLGFDEVAGRFFQAAGVEALLLDDGFMGERILPVAWHARFAPAHRLLRVEQLAEQLIGRVATWSDFQDLFRIGIRNPPADVVALKSIAAYRTGLAVDEPRLDAAVACFDALRARSDREKRVRLDCKPLNDWVVRTTLGVAAETGMPVQLHTGFGDPDLDLRQANPLHLRPLFEEPAFREVLFVLLHAAYPFTREAGYLASVYPNVYVDLGLAIPSLSVSGMASTIRALFELAPLSKIMFASDAHLIPELFYLGALWGRRLLARELEGAIRDGDLTADEAQRAAEMILRGTATRLYRLAPPVADQP